MAERWIMHVDMDAFFASVEQRDHAEYRGQPVIVGGLSGRGVVATASYEARAFGVHSAMPMTRAKRLCPQGIFVPGNHAHYAAVSREIFAIFSRYSPLVEPLSIDEAFLDLTGMERLMNSRREYAARLKAEIKKETGLVASVGIAPNKFLAKLASDMEKPDGLVIIEPDRVQEILQPLPVGRLWGVGAKTAARLSALGCHTIGDLAGRSLAELEPAVGKKAAAQLLSLSRGEDSRPVIPEREAQSIGREITFEDDITTYAEAGRQLLALAEEVGWRLRRAERKAQTIQLKVRLADFSTFTRQESADPPVCYDEEIYAAARRLFHSLHPRGPIRLLGITGSGLTEGGEQSLFDDSRKKEQLYTAIDALKKRFGEGIITKAPLVNSSSDRKGTKG